MRHRMPAVVVVVFALVAVAVVATRGQGNRAQAAKGQITGTVVDASGAALRGVAITIRGPERRTTTTNERGEFAFANIIPGEYDLSFELAGFRTVRSRVLVASGGAEHLKVPMSPGARNETDSFSREELRDDAAPKANEVPVPRPAPQAAPEAAFRSGVADGVAGGVVGLSASGRYHPGNALPGRYRGPLDTEAYDHVDENGFRRVGTDPLSTFSIDVDTASYANVRRFLREGSLPPAGAVRTEELINYFRFNYPQPADGSPFSITTELTACPWNPRHRLALVGIQGREIAEETLPPRNLVFLIDVSGSMMSPDKLPLVRDSLMLLANQLTERDRLAIVVYAGASGLVLPSTPGDRKDVIRRAIESLEAGGSTNGAEGIQLAYRVASEHFVEKGINRVVLATDGDFNVGVTSQDELVRLIEQKRRSGVFLSVLGVGTGNLKDSTMEKLADKGNGNYSYLDSIHEARKVLVREAGSTLVTIAKDVKIQVEFNPRTVGAYRLLGYENRLLRNEDFNDDAKDAGEIGAGHSVTALYEIVPAGVEIDTPKVDPLKYQREVQPTRAASAQELATIKVRYKAPDGDTSRLVSTVLSDGPAPMTANIGFASAVAEFSMLLRDSKETRGASYEAVLARARRFRGEDREGYRAEFITLAGRASTMRSSEDRQSRR